MAEEKTIRLSQAARKLNVGTSTIAEHLATKGFKIENKPNTKITVEQFDMLSKEFASSAMDKEEALGLTIGKKHGENLVIDSEKGEGPEKRDEEEEIFIKNLAAEKEKQERELAQKQKEEKEREEKEKQEKEKQESATSTPKLQGIKVVGKIELDDKKKKKEELKAQEEKAAEEALAKEKEEAAKKAREKEAEEKRKIELEKKEQEEKEKKERELAEKEKKEEIIEGRADQLKGLTVVGKIELPEERKKSGPQPVASSDDQKEKKKKN